MTNVPSYPAIREATFPIHAAREVDAVARGIAIKDGSIIIQRLVWAFRVVPNARCGRHRTGYVVTWPGQPLLKCESQLERRVLHALASNSACVGLATQPLTLWYRWNGRNYRYTPDILGIFTPSSATPPTVRLFEVKPLARLAAFKTRLSRHSIALEKAVAMPLTVLTECSAGEIAEVLS
jgi:hypothetical protein